ncbi:hypothetical protein IFM89_001883, partial [Coptis chinensis]
MEERKRSKIKRIFARVGLENEISNLKSEIASLRRNVPQEIKAFISFIYAECASRDQAEGGETLQIQSRVSEAEDRYNRLKVLLDEERKRGDSEKKKAKAKKKKDGAWKKKQVSKDHDESGEVDHLKCMVLDDGENNIVAKNFPVCDDRHSELIPCLDKNLIYQMRLKLDLSLMEHYERHCPLPERRFNCLIPPPTGYKVNSLSERWSQSSGQEAEMKEIHSQTIDKKQGTITITGHFDLQTFSKKLNSNEGKVIKGIEIKQNAKKEEEKPKPNQADAKPDKPKQADAKPDKPQEVKAAEKPKKAEETKSDPPKQAAPAAKASEPGPQMKLVEPGPILAYPWVQPYLCFCSTVSCVDAGKDEVLTIGELLNPSNFPFLFVAFISSILTPSSTTHFNLRFFAFFGCMEIMILVDDAGGAWARIDHSPWNGCTLADFIMPFFLFIVGVAIALALKRIQKVGDTVKKIIIRTIKLLLWGIILQGGYSHAPDDLSYGIDMKQIHWRGILQRIALVYLIVALIETFTTKVRPTILKSGHFSIFSAYRWQWLGGFIAFLIYMITTFSLYVSDWSYEFDEDHQIK